MNDDLRVAGGVILGAVIGGVAAHLLLTDRGCRSLGQLGPALGEVSQTARDIGFAVERLGRAMREGRQVARELRTSAAEIRSQVR